MSPSFCLQMSWPAVWSVTSWLEGFVMSHRLLVRSAARSRLQTRPLWMQPRPFFPLSLSLNTTVTWWPETATMFIATQVLCTPWWSKAPPFCRCWVSEVPAEMRQTPQLFPPLFQPPMYLRATPGRPPPHRLLPISGWTATSTVCSRGRSSQSGPANPGPASAPTPQRASSGRLVCV